MNWIETLLITLGISLDIFGIVTCEGALLAEIEKNVLRRGAFWLPCCRPSRCILEIWWAERPSGMISRTNRS